MKAYTFSNEWCLKDKKSAKETCGPATVLLKESLTCFPDVHSNHDFSSLQREQSMANILQVGIKGFKPTWLLLLVPGGASYHCCAFAAQLIGLILTSPFSLGQCQ